MVLLIDNYDSFTYNLAQYLGELGADVHVVRNDRITVEGIRDAAPTHLVLSPGPKYPKDAGVTLDAIHALSGSLPILGVCLGHQAIGEAFGGRVVRATEIIHGKKSPILLQGDCALFNGLPCAIEAARYHSLIVEKASLPEVLAITARDPSGEIMGLRHREHPTYGVQFHPESILTPKGKDILANFLAL